MVDEVDEDNRDLVKPGRDYFGRFLQKDKAGKTDRYVGKLNHSVQM